jgi:uncharacterized membrane protein
MNESRTYRIFQAGVLLKGAYGLIECAGGLALAVSSDATIRSLVGALTQHELIRSPNDLIANYLAKSAETFTISTQHVYAFYLLSHGLIKVVLVIALLKNRLWAYPVSLAILGLFVVYQLYRFSYTHGLGLLLLSVFDVVVLGLIWHEYRLVRRHLSPT